MRANSQRPAVPTTSLLAAATLVAGHLAAQDQAAAVEKPVVPANAAPKAKPPADDVTAGLPPFLRFVPGGTVQVGLTSESLVAAACQVVAPDKPADAVRRSEEKVRTALRRTASSLGRQTHTVEPFLLGIHNVKNSEYAAFVDHMRQHKVKVRAPFHWWRYGRADDYNARIKDINTQFPKDKFGPLNYWAQHGADLPYKVANERGDSIADMPLVYVTVAEANTFAGWLGMRLPTEVEWIRAARGDGKHDWPGGENAYSENLLKTLRLYNSRDQQIKPTGTVAEAAGPFGHQDMFGSVWQWVAERGYRPINGAELFADEWKSLQKDKAGALLGAPPVWKGGEIAIAKGGSYLSASEPIQLMIDQRAPIDSSEALEGCGFRVAKSLRPGYDTLFSLLRGVYNRSPFAEEQDIDLSLQVGAERYELGKDGFPTDYLTISFAPVNWLTNDKSQDLNKLLDRSQTTPLLIGTLALTEKLAEPAVEAGHYSVMFRKEGMPKELTDALKVGYKEVQEAKKQKAKNGGKDNGKEGQEPKAGGWRDVLARFGLAEQDLVDAESLSSIKFVRIDEIKVPTEGDCYLLFGNEGKVVAVLPATNKKPALGNPFVPTIELGADEKGRMKARFRIGMPLQQQNPKRFVDLQMDLVVDLAPPAADKAWRVPPPAK